MNSQRYMTMMWLSVLVFLGNTPTSVSFGGYLPAKNSIRTNGRLNLMDTTRVQNLRTERFRHRIVTTCMASPQPDDSSKTVQTKSTTTSATNNSSNKAYESLETLKRNVLAVDKQLKQLKKRKLAAASQQRQQQPQTTPSSSSSSSSPYDKWFVSINELAASADGLELQADDLENDTEQALAAITILASRYMITVEKSQQALTLAMGRIAQLELKLGNSQDKADLFETKWKQTSRDYQSLQRQHEKITSNIDKLESLVQIVKKDAVEANEERQLAQNELLKVQSQLNYVELKLEQADQRELLLQQALEQTNKTLQDTTTKLTTMIQKESILKASVLQTRDEYMTLQQKYERVQKSLNKALEKMSSVKQNDDTLLDELKPAFIALYEEHKKLKDMNFKLTQLVQEEEEGEEKKAFMKGVMDKMKEAQTGGPPASA